MKPEDKNKENSNLSNWLEKEALDIDPDDLNLWEPYAKLIVEFQEMAHKFEFTQTEIAKKMNTKQSVISRFVNMGRLPSYEFLVRLSNALNGKLGITLNANYMATVPIDKIDKIIEHSNVHNVSTKNFVQNLLNKAIEEIENNNQYSVVTSKQNDLLRFADFHEILLKNPSSNEQNQSNSNYSSTSGENMSVAIAY